LSATLFLVVLIVGLVLGNVFLSLTSPRRIQRALMAENGLQELSSESDFVPYNAPSSTSAEFDQPPMIAPPSLEQQVVKDRFVHLNKRMDRMEQLLLKINESKFLAQKLNGTNLVQKLNKVDKFQQTTKLEIAALNQRLDKILPEKKRVKKPGPGISDEKLREIVFRSAH